MKPKTNELSPVRLNRLRAQGYSGQSDDELSQIAFGNRFAYRSCVSILIIGVAFSSVPLLSAMMFIAFLGVVLPNHPFDYFYNGVLSKWMHKPQLPRRSVQLKFACSLATIWIGVVIYLFTQEMMITAYIVATMLIATSLLVSTIDFCIPSIVFNALFTKVKTTETIA